MRGVAWAATACCLALGVPAGSAVAQVPLQDITVGDVIEMLRDRADRKYDYKKTAPPDTRTNLCADQAVQGAANGRSAAARLGVVELPAAVPYAGGEGPKLELAIQFALGQDALLLPGKKLLDIVHRGLDEPSLSTARLAVAGHADVSGNEPDNLKLSCARALAVRQYLIDKGVAPARLTAYGFGSSRLLPSHLTQPNSPVHRRVELRRAP